SHPIRRPNHIHLTRLLEISDIGDGGQENVTTMTREEFHQPCLSGYYPAPGKKS
ncbi:hypothetical protein COCCADRAFT_109833, partial [Bipolaris zeicola 26-R-13]